MNAVPLQSFNNSRLAALVPAAAILGTLLGCMALGEAIDLSQACQKRSTVVAIYHEQRSPVIGIYHGSVVEASNATDSALSRDPVDTTFTQLPNGTLIGDYKVTEVGETYTGHLVQNGPMRDHHVTFEWTDRFGHGTVDAAFDDDYCQFAGKWRNDEGSMVNQPWDGFRKPTKD